MVFTDYIKSLPNVRLDTTKRIMRECNVTQQTLSRWVRGEMLPNEVNRGIISRVLGIEADVLFPGAKEEGA